MYIDFRCQSNRWNPNIQTTISYLFRWTNVEGMGLVSRQADTGQIQGAKRASEIEAILIPIVTMMLMFMMQLNVPPRRTV